MANILRSFCKKKSSYFIFLTLLLFYISLITATTHAHNKNYKEAFIKKISFAAQNENKIILLDRNKILNLKNTYSKNNQIDTDDSEWLLNISQKYKIKNFNFKNQNDWNRLLNRVNVIPVSLVIAQAAHESNWGKSRFSTQANNYFGQHCLTEGCGIKPKIINPKNKFEVTVFTDMAASVKSYINNLNTNYHYKKLRSLREQLKKENIKITGLILAEGLDRYSQQKNYVDRIRFIIKTYNLDIYDN